MTTNGRRRIGFEFNPHIVGGTETFLRSLLLHLDSRRFRPVAIATSPGRWQRFLEGVAETHVVPYAQADGTAADVATSLRELELDLLQSSYFSPVLALAATKIGLPNVWRLGGHVDALDRSWEEGEKERLLSVICMLSRRIICGSRFLQSQFPPADRDRVEVIRNGIDFASLPSPPSQAATAPRIAMVAHLVPQKRHPVFLRAAAIVAALRPEARFFIFGGSYRIIDTRGLEAYEHSLHSLAEQLRLADRLEIRELHSDRFLAMGEIDVFAAPGVNEGSSNAIIEAMALGKPVVAAASGGNPELIEDRVTGRLVEPEDPDELAHALIELLEKPALRARIGAAARARLEQELDMGVCARRYERLYDEVVGEKR